MRFFILFRYSGGNRSAIHAIANKIFSGARAQPPTHNWRQIKTEEEAAEIARAARSEKNPHAVALGKRSWWGWSVHPSRIRRPRRWQTNATRFFAQQLAQCHADRDATRPPGLLVGISATTPSANTDHNQACIEDAATLTAAVSTVAANGEIIFVCAPKQATTLRLRTFGFPYLVLASSALPDKTVICIAANALASATDPLPRFALSDQATIVERDDPAPISTSGTIAVPTRSLWQTDTISLRLIFEMSWVLRAAAGLALMQNVLW